MSKVRALSVEAKRASQFQTVLNITTTPMFGGSTEEMQLVGEDDGISMFAIYLRILIQNGEVVVDASFDPNVICERQIRRTLHQFDHSIHLLAEGSRDLARALNGLGIATDGIEAVHPVSAVQEGILLAQAKSSVNVYMQEVVLNLAPVQKQSMDIERLAQAWASVCRAHPMLRSLFVSGISTANGFVQVVLKKASPSVSYVDSTENGDVNRSFTTRDPPHHLQIRKVPNADEVHMTLYSNHALLDATAITIVASDLARAYTLAGSLADGKSFTEYLQWARAREAQSQEYWKTYLSGAKPCRLPTLAWHEPAASPSTSSHVDATFRHADQVHQFCQQSGVTVATFMQVAWAIVLTQFTCSDQITFGYLCSDRDAFDGAEEIVGPLISMLTARVEVGSDSKISELLQRLKSDLANGMAYSACSMASVQDSLGLGHEALFDTVLSLQHEVPRSIGAEVGTLIHITPIAINDPTEYTVALQVLSSRQLMRVRLEYQQSRIPTGFASEIMKLLHSVTWSLTQGAITSSVASIIGDRNVLSLYQKGLIKQWNAEVPQIVAGCLHDRIKHTAARHPHAPAVCFGSCEIDYATLDSLSDRLAVELNSSQGVRAEQIVPFFCEKGLEAVVFMLAIIKAGAVILGLDVNHPDERIHDILEDAKAPLVIAQLSLAARARTITRGTVVSYDLNSIIAPSDASPSLSVDSAQLAYCIYTSGSTGKPKGILVPHSSIVTSLTSAMKPFGIGQHTRISQISSFAFDMSIVEVFQTLLAGGCICIPTEQERMNDIENAVTRMHANFVYFTPSMAEILHPDKLPTLMTLVLMGETLTTEAVDRWHGKLRLMACYGPAESAALSSCADVVKTQIANLGLPFGCRYWVVDEHDHDQLVPIGQRGELLIQGPIVSRGYIKDPEKTAKSFICPPAWTKDFLGQWDPTQPFYKTGDLVIQNPDGSVAHVGRKDLQVKLLGQRIELKRNRKSSTKTGGGAEWHVIVELIRPKQPSQSPFLAVFMSRTSKILPTSYGSTLDQPLDPMPKIARTMHEMLSTIVPSYMVPKIYIPVTALPLNSSCKADRKRLKDMAELLIGDQILRYNTLNPAGRDTVSSMDGSDDASGWGRAPIPLNDTGAMLRQLWSQVLSIPQSSIHADSEWMGLGGNSFKAIQLVSAAREQGLSLTVADIFRNPRLDQLSNLALVSSPSSGIELISEKQAAEPFSLLSVPSSTAREEAARLCGVHVSQIEHMYPCTALQQALLAVSSRQAGEFVGQAKFLLDPQISVGRLQRAWGKLVEDTPILRTRIVDIPAQGLTQVVIDQPVAWVSCKAEGLEFRRPRALYQSFVRYVSNVTHDEEGASYWREQFAGLAAPQWPPLPSSSYEAWADAKLQYENQDISAPQRFTLPIAIRTAWATLLTQYTAASEVVFGVVSSGRQADLAGIEGPVLATVPIRITVDPRSSADDLVWQVQEQAAAMAKWEQFGLMNIQLCGPETKLACRFQSLLLVQPAEQLARNLVRGSRLFSKAEIIESTNPEHRNTSTDVTIFLECEQIDRNLRLLFDFDSNVINKQAVARIAQQFEEKCVHHMLKPVFARRSSCTAIDAWDGRLTYGQLDTLTHKLSQRLIELGVQPNSHVPLFFEKSMWSPVAALAVMKAGGACVMLDVAQPAHRIKSIKDQIRPALALTSSKQVTFARGITNVRLMVVDQSHIDDIVLESTVTTFESPRPCDTLYVAFTSGSTGHPKGIVISHANFCSALQHQAKAIGLTEESRTLNVSSYAWDMSCEFTATTPTIANFLTASDLETLRGIELGGEKPSTELISKIRHSGARYRNIYGPTECTVISTGLHDLRDPSHIGVGVGLVPWVVDPASGKLAPVGCVGELWLEGPLVAQGYLNDYAQSGEVFIDAPDWLRNGSATSEGRQSKMYRTGDLVRYEPDASLILIGRNDGQIKVRGQRLELAEVEYHVKRQFSVSSDINVIVEPVVNDETGIAALTAFIIASNFEEAGLEKTAGLLVSDEPDAVVAPASEVEPALRDVCAETLAVCQNSVSVTADWLKLGGDSITAMQAVFRARQNDLNLTMDLLIRGGTLREIAACIASPPPHIAEVATTAIRSPKLATRKIHYFDLSPVQQWYLEDHSAKIPFDVPVYLKMKSEVESTALRKAIELVISRHSILRALFQEDPATGTWKQFIVPQVTSSYEMHTHQYAREEEIPALIRQSRERIDAETGPLTVVSFFNHPDNSQSLFFSTYHLVSDFMSWRIVANELQDILSGRPLAPVRASEYRDWVRVLKDFFEKNFHPDVAMPNHSALAVPQLHYWNLALDGIPSQQDIDELRLVLDHSTSSKLLNLGRKASQVSLHELIVASLLYSFGQAFLDRETLPACFCAGDGQDSFANGIDVGQTVGWFTATMPVQLAKETCRSADLVTIIRATKAAARSLPYKGWAYTPSRFFHPAGMEMLNVALPELFLNFTGTSLQQLESSDSLFSLLETLEASQLKGAEQVAPIGVFTFSGHVRERQLHFVSKSIAGRQNNQVLLKNLERTLVKVSSLCAAAIF
ncbi:acetyl-CoA synthetase-like protein [Teratosphaeria nubilosa]|uniref:Acetyl-CoA synthetase-like protein n=1 Tax=Teratosphaeria nubilosa TaxID=161662 RepID=A0A6G1KTU8_9PEZI|nr:acetyl-CoA synthetase-like protein [Teratosphaeria nubilosa]